MKKITFIFFEILKISIVIALGLMVVLVFGNVVLRYGFNLGITISEELSRMLFVWLTFVSALLALHERTHLGMDTFVSKLPPTGKRVALIICQVLMLYATWLFLKGSWQQTAISLDVGATAPVTGMSMGWFYGVGIFYSSIGMLIILADIYQVVSGELHDEELIMVKDSEANIVEEPLNKINVTKS